MRLFLAFSISLLAAVHVAVAKPPQSEQEREAALRNLTWRDGEAVKLPLSRGILRAPANIRQLTGSDAATISEVINGVDAPPGIEAFIYDPAVEAHVFYQKLGTGYVRLDDWDEVDPAAMLQTISENTEADNAQRRAAGISPIHVVGWIERPHLDRTANTVRWSLDAIDEKHGSIFNSVALVLGRDGFEKLTWAGPKTALSTDLLRTAQASFSFAAGERHTDFKDGDKVAAYGIAGLVASVAGAKAVTKAGVFAALAVFAKKAGALIVIPIVALFGLLFGYLKRLFRQKTRASAASSTTGTN